jgi:hypothetical protein
MRVQGISVFENMTLEESIAKVRVGPLEALGEGGGPAASALSLSEGPLVTIRRQDDPGSEPGVQRVPELRLERANPRTYWGVIRGIRDSLA